MYLGSVSDDNNEFEADMESDETESIDLKSATDRDAMSEKSEDSKLDKEDEDSNLMDYGKIPDKKTDILAVEQDLLNKAAEIEKVNEAGDGRVNKTVDSKSDVKDKEVKPDKIEDQAVKSPPKLDSFGKNQELFPAKDMEMPNIQDVDEPLTAVSPVASKEKKEDTKNNVEKVSDAKVTSEDITPSNKAEGNLDNMEDKVDLKEDIETESLLEQSTEKEVKEKAKATEAKDKVENEVEKKRGRKKDPTKTQVVEKKEPGKEKRRGRPTLASIAEKKAASQGSVKPPEEGEPVSKKGRDKAAEDTGEVQSTPVIKQEEASFETSTKNDEEIQKEENEFEKKKVKKKVKRKAEGSSDTEAEKKEKKEPAKGTGKTGKAEKAPKSKGKKVKEEEGEVDSGSVNEWEDNSQGESDSVPSDSNKSQTVILSESAGAQPSESACKDIVKDSSANLAESNVVESKSEECVDSKSSASRLPNSSALYENTPPSTPEHEMDAPSVQHTHDLVKGDCNNSNDQQYASESPSGNASPSSNDGSVGSGNVACSESSNNEAPVHTSLGKRRRESEDATPTKRKRRGKQKPDRKLSKQTGKSNLYIKICKSL